jgi:branched-chain amino acid transport system substrate-binding protein
MVSNRYTERPGKYTERPDGDLHGQPVRAGRRRRFRAAAAIASAVAIAGLAACSSGSGSASSSGGGGVAGQGSTSTSPGVTSNSVTIGLMTSFTGPAAAQFANVYNGFAAYIAKVNAAGGVNGRKINIVKVDDQGSPSAAVTAVRSAVQVRHIFALASVGITVYAVEAYLKGQNVPVIGVPIDGPEWAPPNNNMFAVIGSASAKYPAPVFFGKYLKSGGCTRVGMVVINVPSAVGAAKNAIASAKAQGIAVPYANLTIPTTQTGFDAIAQSLKAANIDCLYSEMIDPENLSLLAAVKAAGISTKVTVLDAQPTSADLQNPQNKADLQGAVAYGPFYPPNANTAGTKAVASALATYQGQTTPYDENEAFGWMSAAGVVAGLQAAGKNLTRADYMSSLRNVSGFDAGGIGLTPLDFTASFGTGAQGGGPAPDVCVIYSKLSGTNWVVDPTQVCGGLLSPPVYANP